MTLPAITPRAKNAILLTFVVAVVAAIGFDMYRKSGQPVSQGQQEAAAVLTKVRALYDLPAQPEPTVATVVDVEQLRQKNAFYNRAKNGDVLIVTETRAILYDPVKNIILDVVPVQIQQAPPQAASSSAPKK